MPSQGGDCLQAAQQGLSIIGGYANFQRLQQAPKLLGRQTSHAIWVHLQCVEQQSGRCQACKQQCDTPQPRQCTSTVAQVCQPSVGVQCDSVRALLRHLPCTFWQTACRPGSQHSDTAGTREPDR